MLEVTLGCCGFWACVGLGACFGLCGASGFSVLVLVWKGCLAFKLLYLWSLLSFHQLDPTAMFLGLQECGLGFLWLMGLISLSSGRLGLGLACCACFDLLVSIISVSKFENALRVPRR